MTGDVNASGSMRLNIATGRRERATVLVAKREMFIKATRAFWHAADTSAPGRVADLLSGRWMKVPPAEVADAMRDFNSSSSTTTASDIRFSAFNELVNITAPLDALDLSQLSGATGTQS